MHFMIFRSRLINRPASNKQVRLAGKKICVASWLNSPPAIMECEAVIGQETEDGPSHNPARRWLRSGKPAVTLGGASDPARMKSTDDYKAKYRLWAANPRVVAAPPAPRLPKFASRRFSSHAEMNEWKRNLLRELARAISPHE
jgi:hypothetical protein